MEEVSNGIILNDIKNFDYDKNSEIRNNGTSIAKPIFDKGILSKFISGKINKMKGWASINDKDG